ncbi:MAG TPA: tripartite tricarboxylate transporter substrate binding protein, partial [Thermodesulfobacteriota bacterium]|nr:tripartite tricarboxylate transporter substrate binding protein [Thermodesulfobacteriota bacterium]
MKRRVIWALAFIASVTYFAIGTESALAKFPDRKIRIVCPFEAGGGTDLMARTFARYANPILGGKLFVENVTGGGGLIGVREGLNAKQDGYTL